jgi:hypothetical protein
LDILSNRIVHLSNGATYQAITISKGIIESLGRDVRPLADLAHAEAFQPLLIDELPNFIKDPLTPFSHRDAIICCFYF